MGGALQGVEAAARHYFAIPAHAMTLSQSLVLAGIPQQPEKLRPDVYPEQAAYWTSESLCQRFPNITRLQSTIDLAWQLNVQSLVARIEQDRDDGNAIIVLDNATGEIRVRAGSHSKGSSRLSWMGLSSVVRSFVVHSPCR